MDNRQQKERLLKAAFFRKYDAFFFQIAQKTILSFQVQDSVLEYIFLEIWRFEKHIALSEKKPPLANVLFVVCCPFCVF